MPEPTGFSPATLAMSARYDVQPNVSALFFNCMAGRDARGVSKGLVIILRELRSAVAAGETVKAADIMPATHRLTPEEQEVWWAVAGALCDLAAKPDLDNA